MRANPSPDIAALVEQFFRSRGAGRRVSVDEVLAEAGAERDAETRSAVLEGISRRVRNSSSQSIGVSGSFAGAAAEAAPREIPGYDLIEEIGRGGMGTVYEAYQQSTGRRVAVKLISQVIAGNESARRRFEREVELVARLQHPHIVSVLDSGIHGGRYFYVMEYVEGRTLDAWIDRNAETWKHGNAETGAAGASPSGNPQSAIRTPQSLRDLLGLVARISDAVEYAHQRGVLHRDLKPSNILVEEGDSAASPKILDFGLAKDIDPLALDRRALTLAEPGEILGTLAYMAPEQARGAHEEMSVRADVYSLGAIAYEAVTGRLPCSTVGALHDVLERIQRTDPPRPSSVCRGLDADVDAILLKALDKSPERRYATAGELAADLRRRLNNEPVAARPSSTFNQLRKFARRNKVLVGGAAATTVALAVGMVVSLLLYAQARRHQAETQQVAEFQGSMLQNVDAEQMGLSMRHEFRRQVEQGLRQRWVEGDDKKMRKMSEAEIAAALEQFDVATAPGNPTDVARHMMDAAVLKPTLAAIEREFADQPEIAAKLYLTAGQIYISLGLNEAAEPLVRESLRIARLEHGDAHPDVTAGLASLAGLVEAKGDFAEAEALYRDALALNRGMLGSDHPIVAENLHDLAGVLQFTREDTAAEAMYVESLAIRRARLGDAHPAVADSLDRLSHVMGARADYDSAERLCREALAIRRASLGDEHGDVRTSLKSLAGVMSWKGDYAAAEPLLREGVRSASRTYGEDHTVVAQYKHELSQLLEARGEYREAELLAREALDVRRRLLGRDNPAVAESLNCLASVLHHKGDYAAAEPLFREALAMRRRQLGSDNHLVGASINNLAGLLLAKGDHAEVEPLYREALRVLRSAHGETHPDVASVLNNLAMFMRSKGDYAAAEPLAREALAVWRIALDEDHPQVGKGLYNLALVLQSQGNHAEAEPLFREARAIWEKKLPDHTDTALCLWYLARTQEALGHLDDAEQTYLDSLALYRRLRGDENTDVADVLHALGIVRQAQGDLAGAEGRLSEALAMRSTLLGDAHGGTLFSRAALAEVLGGQRRYAEAEPHYRELLAQMREQTAPDSVAVGAALRDLGLNLRRQDKFAEAEALLLSSFRILEAYPESAYAVSAATFEEMIELYEAWHVAEPGMGQDAKASEWRAMRTEREAPSKEGIVIGAADARG